MSRAHIVRFGAIGDLGGFLAAEPVSFPRGTRVVVRTARGLETGEVLSPPDESAQSLEPTGTILRRLTVEDTLLEARLLKNRQSAFEACAARIEARGLPVVLMDVEHLFDGQSLIFYFLGKNTPELDLLLNELAEEYEAKVQFRQFTEILEQGCGPGCGTEEGAGAGCASCGTGCAISSACSSTRAKTAAPRG